MQLGKTAAELLPGVLRVPSSQLQAMLAGEQMGIKWPQVHLDLQINWKFLIIRIVMLPQHSQQNSNKCFCDRLVFQTDLKTRLPWLWVKKLHNVGRLLIVSCLCKVGHSGPVRSVFYRAVWGVHRSKLFLCFIMVKMIRHSLFCGGFLVCCCCSVCLLVCFFVLNFLAFSI